MAYVPDSGSVAAWLQSNNASVITVSKGSVATVIVGGSIAASFTPPANQSVSGTVTVNQGTSPWIVTGSVQASITPAANQSVSGTIGASIIGIGPVSLNGIPGSGNTYISSVAGGGSIQGSWETNANPGVLVSATTDTAGFLYFDFSNDGGTTFNTFPPTGFSVLSGTHEIHDAIKGPRSFRTRFTSAGNAGSRVDVNTYYGTFGPLNSPLNLSMTPDTDAQVVKAAYQVQYAPSVTSVSDGFFDVPTITRLREVRTRDQRAIDIENCNNASLLSAFNSDASTPTDTADHIFGTGAVTFNKVNGAANTIYGLADRTLPGAITVSEIFEDSGFVAMAAKFPSVSDINYALIRLGTDNANYNEWRWPQSVLSAGSWNNLLVPTGQPSSYVGAGWNTNAVTYVAFGAAFNAETDTLSGMVFDNIHLVGGRLTDAITQTNITSQVTTPNINLLRIANTLAATNSGTATAGTLRVTQANDIPVRTLTSIQGNVSVSGTVGASTIGTVPVTQTTVPWVIGSVYGNVSGSVVAFQGAGWSGSVAATITNTNINVSGSVVASGTVTANQGNGFGSVATHIKSGSVIAVLGGNTSVLAIQSGTSRPSAISFVTRNDAVASFLGGNLTYTPQSADSAGRNLIKPFAPEEARVEGYISLTSTSVTTLVAAAGAGLRNYITDLWVANTGAAATLVTFVSGGGASVLGYTIAPAGGGSNLPGLQTPIQTLANQTFGVQAGTATSTLYVTVKGYKAP